ncbi:hypothetical protein [Acidianus brierleyi]|uniref:Uncharacterized protein n=1 Tax=Acidianus brierleyi TaxID=41673 RepID=A0A2U9IG87_9CREN|nr:hypothetical protein [Acidianus brierleyi]AWR95067.1 hypothetical protein DFR85_11105 [Acidianus brierleyi]
MVRLINWKLNVVESSLNIEEIIDNINSDVIILPLSKNRIIEYIKSQDIDTLEKLVIRKEKKVKIRKEIKKLSEEGFSINILIKGFNKYD